MTDAERLQMNINKAWDEWKDFIKLFDKGNKQAAFTVFKSYQQKIEKLEWELEMWEGQ